MKVRDVRFSPELFVQGIMAAGVLFLAFDHHALRSSLDDYELAPAATAGELPKQEQLATVLEGLVERLEQLSDLGEQGRETPTWAR